MPEPARPETRLIAVATRPLRPPRDDLFDALLPALPPLIEGDVVVITSKVVAIDEGRCVPITAATDKQALVAAEADAVIPAASSKFGIPLAIKGSTLIASAGIDASNADGHLVLWPADPSAAACRIGRRLRALFGLTRLGVIVTDSHCVPLRRGTVGIAIGSYGFAPVHDYRGSPDIFGRPLEVTTANSADAMAAAAVGIMGEGAECRPAAIVRDWPGLDFHDRSGDADLFIPPDEDIFAPLLKAFAPASR